MVRARVIDSNLFRRNSFRSALCRLGAIDTPFRGFGVKVTYGKGPGGKPTLSVATANREQCTLLWLEQKGEPQKVHIRWAFHHMGKKTAFANPALLRDLQARLNRVYKDSYTDDDMTSNGTRRPLKDLADEKMAAGFAEILMWAAAQATQPV